jgi:hypothetical protein
LHPLRSLARARCAISARRYVARTLPHVGAPFEVWATSPRLM